MLSKFEGWLVEIEGWLVGLKLLWFGGYVLKSGPGLGSLYQSSKARASEWKLDGKSRIYFEPAHYFGNKKIKLLE